MSKITRFLLSMKRVDCTKGTINDKHISPESCSSRSAIVAQLYVTNVHENR